MAKRIISVLLSLVMLMSASIAVTAYAADSGSDAPALTSISFKNAKIDGNFSSDVMNYTITLDDNTAPAVLESYKLKGECELFVSYIYDDAKRQTGICARVEYPTGSAIYTFDYANPAEYEVNSNNTLVRLDCTYGELQPEMNEKDAIYKLYIPSDLTTLVITPIAEDINAYCPPVELTMSEGQETDIIVKCVASDGTAREYLIKIKRVEKTLEQVKAEMQEEDFTSFVEGTRFYERTEFIIVMLSAICGIIIIVLLYRFIKRIALSPYDAQEKQFFDEAD